MEAKRCKENEHAGKQAGPAPRGILVLDFDKTLATIEVGTFILGEPRMIPKRVFGGEQRVETIRRLLEQLTRQGVYLCVLSYNEEHTIRKALGCKYVKLQQYFSTIIGNSTMAAAKPDRMYKKSSWITRIAESQGVETAERVMFVDDSSENIRDVMGTLPRCNTLFVEKRAGIMRKEVAQILQWAATLGSADSAGQNDATGTSDQADAAALV